jgi:hypothetical protein
MGVLTIDRNEHRERSADHPHAALGFDVDFGAGRFEECSNGGSSITLKRGLINVRPLFEWLRALRNGTSGPRTVQIEHGDATWLLHDAIPTSHACGPFIARAQDVAIAELTLSYARLEVR